MPTRRCAPLPLTPLAVLVFLLFAALGILPPAAAAAALRTPLLQEGKQTLYQRVISHPGAKTAAAPGEAATEALRSFTPLYVYGRRHLLGEDWLEVAPGATAMRTRWIRANACSPWNKALTLMFAERISRDPVLFFRRFEALNALVRSQNMRPALDALLQAPAAPEGPLLAVRTTGNLRPRKQFYLMPFSTIRTNTSNTICGCSKSAW